jgi:hypothetical protein
MHTKERNQRHSAASKFLRPITDAGYQFPPSCPRLIQKCVRTRASVITHSRDPVDGINRLFLAMYLDAETWAPPCEEWR